MESLLDVLALVLPGRPYIGIIRVAIAFQGTLPVLREVVVLEDAPY